MIHCDNKVIFKLFEVIRSANYSNTPMIAAQVAGRPEGVCTTEVLF